MSKVDVSAKADTPKRRFRSQKICDAEIKVSAVAEVPLPPLLRQWRKWKFRFCGNSKICLSVTGPLRGVKFSHTSHCILALAQLLLAFSRVLLWYRSHCRFMVCAETPTLHPWFETNGPRSAKTYLRCFAKFSRKSFLSWRTRNRAEESTRHLTLVGTVDKRQWRNEVEGDLLRKSLSNSFSWWLFGIARWWQNIFWRLEWWIAGWY